MYQCYRIIYGKVVYENTVKNFSEDGLFRNSIFLKLLKS